jgi:flagellar hook assembly protein FlgD
MVQDLMFEVIGRSKSEKITKEGNRETTFKVSLKSSNGKVKLTISDSEPTLIQKYPLGGEVPVQIDTCSQTTLTDAQEQQVGKDAEKASEDAGRAE